MQMDTFSRTACYSFFICLVPFIICASTKAQDFFDYGITKKDVDSAVEFAYLTTNLSERLEANIRRQVALRNGSPAFGLHIAYRPDAKAMARGRKAVIAMKTTTQLANTFCVDYKLNYEECFDAVMKISMNDSSLGSFCEYSERVCSGEESRDIYRSSEGSCNNIRKGSLGESFTGYKRILPPEYSDHINVVRRARDKSALPNARKISSTIADAAEAANDRFTLAVPQWGQFLEHDLSRFASSIMYHYNDSFECCAADGRNLAPRYLHPFCMPVEVPSDDKYYAANGLQCMSYARSLPAIRDDCHFGWIDQLNQATHLLDGSQIYGATIEKTAELRSFTGGKLRTHRMGDKNYLPLSEHPTEDCQVKSRAATCFASGDPRVNQHPHLAVMHTLWTREHDRIAEGLARVNEHWDDETLFQETRRIVVAEMQHITYDEWMPKILGEEYSLKINDGPPYDENVDPSVSNSFATAAIRSLQSMFTDRLRLVNEDRDDNDTSSVALHDHFNNPEILLQTDVFDSLVRGLASQSSGDIGRHYATDLITKLFSDDRFGYDTLSLDIQRSRDHGLRSYDAYRNHCGLQTVESIGELEDHMSTANAQLLAGLYSDPDDVDLIVGGLLETPRPGGLVGPTFACLMEDQLLRTRQGDRYFYDNDGQPKPFSPPQLHEIQKVTLARVFCDNSDGVEMMQPDVFAKPSASNDLIDCNSDTIPALDLTHWRVTR